MEKYTEISCYRKTFRAGSNSTLSSITIMFPSIKLISQAHAFSFPILCRKHLRLSCAIFYRHAIDKVHQSSSNSRYDSMAKLNISWSNVNCEKDIVNALGWNRWILRILGMWPLVYSDTSMTEKILATITFVLCWSGLSFLLIPMINFIFSERTTTIDKIKLLGPLSYLCITILKYFCLVLRHKDIRRCIHIMNIDWRVVQQEDHRKIMIKNAAESHVLCKFCVIIMYCGGISFQTVMPFLHPRIHEQNSTVLPMPHPGFDIIFDLHFMPTYVVIFCVQWFTGIITFNITTAMCCLAAMLVAHVCGQIEIVMARVESLTKSAQSSRMNSKQRMAIIVKHHVQSLR